MTRIFAVMLAVLFSYPLIIPAVSARWRPELPECCRRDGAHHCAMSSAVRDGSPETALEGAVAKCPWYSGVAPLSSSLSFDVPVRRFDVAAVITRELHRVEAGGGFVRKLFTHSSQERGPPQLFV